MFGYIIYDLYNNLVMKRSALILIVLGYLAQDGETRSLPNEHSDVLDLMEDMAFQNDMQPQRSSNTYMPHHTPYHEELSHGNQFMATYPAYQPALATQGYMQAPAPIRTVAPMAAPLATPMPAPMAAPVAAPMTAPMITQPMSMPLQGFMPPTPQPAYMPAYQPMYQP